MKKLVFISLILGVLPGTGPGLLFAQVSQDSMQIGDREFLRLLKQAEDLNKEQKERAKRTINPRVLNRLAADEDSGVRFYVAFNPWTPVPALLGLARDANETVRWAAAMNTRLLFRIDPKFEDNLASNSISEDLRKAFGTSGAPLEPSTAIQAEEPGSRWVLTTGDREYVVRRVDGNLNVYHRRLPVQMLFELANDYVEIVRMGLASNPNTPPDVLRRLAADVSRSVKQKVAGNPNTEPVILGILARDPDRDVRLEVAQNPHTSLRVMEDFSVESDEAFRVAVAGNRGTSPSILLGLIFDTSIPVRRAIAAHPSMPSPGLIRLSEDADLDVRRAVVQNPNAPPEALKRLSFDKDRNIKTEARNRLGRILKQQIAQDRER